MNNSNKKQQARPVVIEDRFMLTTNYYQGKNSIIYNAVDLKDQFKGIVVQFQIMNQEFNLLKILSKLIQTTLLPDIYYRGQVKIADSFYSYIVMKKGGPNLNVCFQLMKQNLTYRTIALIALKLLSQLQILHQRNLVHLNLKLSSIVTTKNSDLHLCNFDFATKFKIKPICHTIIPIKKNSNNNRLSLHKFSSLGSHLNQNPAPKDDLESMSYLLIYLISHGQLINTNSIQASYQDKVKYYYDVKSRLIAERELKQYPEQFIQFHNMIKNMNNQEMPNYELLKQPFARLLGQFELNFQFDWIQVLNEHSPGRSIEQKKYKIVQSVREFDDLMQQEGISEKESQKSAPTSPKQKAKKTPRIQLKHITQKESKHDHLMLPPILEKNESQLIKLISLRQKTDFSSSSGNLSMHCDDETHVDSPPQFTNRQRDLSI